MCRWMQSRSFKRRRIQIIESLGILKKVPVVIVVVVIVVVVIVVVVVAVVVVVVVVVVGNPSAARRRHIGATAPRYIGASFG